MTATLTVFKYWASNNISSLWFLWPSDRWHRKVTSFILYVEEKRRETFQSANRELLSELIEGICGKIYGIKNIDSEQAIVTFYTQCIYLLMKHEMTLQADYCPVLKLQKNQRKSCIKLACTSLVHTIEYCLSYPRWKITTLVASEHLLRGYHEGWLV